jgi:chorismate mutase-like protein
MEIEDIRKKIDAIDEQLVELLSQRAKAVLEIGHIKRLTGLPIYEPAREKEVSSRVTAANHGPLPNEQLLDIYDRVIDVMRSLQRDAQ